MDEGGKRERRQEGGREWEGELPAMPKKREKLEGSNTTAKERNEEEGATTTESARTERGFRRMPLKVHNSKW